MKKIFFGSFFLLLSLPALADFYPTHYLESREYLQKSFENLKLQFPKAELTPLPVNKDKNLFIDALYIPAQEAKKALVIVTSGIHGVEAFTGSALIFSFLKQMTSEQLQGTGFLFIHAVNPYGYHQLRRVSANNIDLNRNFSASKVQFKSFSPDYKDFEDYLNPTHPLNSSWWSDSLLFLKSLYKLAVFGKKKITQVAVGGQYQNPKGIYFGGTELEPHVSLLKNEFLRVGQDYKRVLHMDLHTGYGQRGRLHFFSSYEVVHSPDFQKVFAGFTIDYAQDKDFYETSGSFGQFTVETFPDKSVVPMTLEFGTLDSQTILGGFFSLRNMIYENQGFHYGYANPTSQSRSQRQFLEMFNPSDPKWRKQVLKTGVETMKTLSQRFSQL